MELNYPASAIIVRPEVNIILFGKLKKDLDSRIHALFFGDSIKERTYTQYGRSSTA
jgi:hypothetical protein